MHAETFEDFVSNFAQLHQSLLRLSTVCRGVQRLLETDCSSVAQPNEQQVLEPWRSLGLSHSLAQALAISFSLMPSSTIASGAFSTSSAENQKKLDFTMNSLQACVADMKSILAKYRPAAVTAGARIQQRKSTVELTSLHRDMRHLDEATSVLEVIMPRWN